MELKEYVVKDYELKVRFLTDHFSRMWTRFNFFLVTETAIVSGKIIFAQPGQNTTALLWTGLIVSVVWYLMSAEDRYLVDLYRSEVKESLRQVKKLNDFMDNADFPLYHVGQVEGVDTGRLGIKSSLVSWRLSAISTTRLAAWIAMLATLAWAGWLFQELVMPRR